MVFNVKDSEERVTAKEADLPFEVVKIEDVPIGMKDGVTLYGYLWIPKEVYEGTSSLKVGTLVEYLPYRKSDFTTVRDSIRHPYYAGYGFASMRVDMRGCGDSDDIILGEYLEQEQQDNYELFDWIIKQPWSNGNIAQFGKSWGGFNSLQIAAKNHPALKCIITLCSTDDRYADDVHYRGGCLMASDMLWWASTMFVYNARPQDPKVQKDWKQNWMKRLELEPNVIDWVKHQSRDEFWKHGSICQDYSKVKIPVLAVGGWRDGYTNSIFRMMENLPNPDNKSIIGPWVHEYPEVATPSPSIGYNQIAVQWFDKYLNTDDKIKAGVEGLNVGEFNVDQLGTFNAYIQDPVTIEQSYIARPGKWIKCGGIEEFDSFSVNNGVIKEGVNKEGNGAGVFSFAGTQEYGLFRGTWCPFGQSGDFPADQKYEDINCLTIDSTSLSQDYEVFGHPEIKFEVSSDVKVANVSVRLVDLDETTGESILVSWGQLNLNKYIGTFEHPQEMKPGEKYDISIKLDAIGYVFKADHKLRLCFSTTDWPSFWPLAQTPTLTISESSVEIKLPKITKATVIENIPRAEALSPCERTIVREDCRTRTVNHDVINNKFEIQDYSDEGERIVNGVQFGSWNKNNWIIHKDDPLAAKNICEWELVLKREGWDIKLHTFSEMKSDEANFILLNKITAFDHHEQVFQKEWNTIIPRCFT